MKHRIASVIALGTLSAAAVALARTADIQLPLPGMWRTDSVETHRDGAGRPVAFLGVTERRLSSDSCMTPEHAATIYTRNPQPSCRFTVQQQGGGRSHTVIDCTGPGRGARYDVTRIVTPTTIEMTTVLSWPGGYREQTVTHSVRTGACP